MCLIHSAPVQSNSFSSYVVLARQLCALTYYLYLWSSTSDHVQVSASYISFSLVPDNVFSVSHKSASGSLVVSPSCHITGHPQYTKQTDEGVNITVAANLFSPAKTCLRKLVKIFEKFCIKNTSSVPVAHLM